MSKKIIIILTFLILFVITTFLNANINVDKIEKDRKINVTLKTDDNQEEINLPLGSTIKDLDIISTNYHQDYILKNNDEIIASNNDELISINNSTIEELIKLPGIGEKIANSIIEYRKNNGDFKSIEEIKNIKGIGDKKYEAIKEYITI